MMPPAVAVIYRAEGLRVGFIQAHSPEVSLPAGTDLARLGELGLRILGMPPAEAHRFAQHYHHILRRKKLSSEFTETNDPKADEH